MNICKPPKEITLAHGSGGQAMQQLIASSFLTAFDNPLLGQREDQARMPLAPLTQQAGVQIVTGDTKVVPRGAADKLFINTAGIGVIPAEINWGAS